MAGVRRRRERARQRIGGLRRRPRSTALRGRRFHTGRSPPALDGWGPVGCRELRCDLGRHELDGRRRRPPSDLSGLVLASLLRLRRRRNSPALPLGIRWIPDLAEGRWRVGVPHPSGGGLRPPVSRRLRRRHWPAPLCRGRRNRDREGVGRILDAGSRSRQRGEVDRGLLRRGRQLPLRCRATSPTSPAAITRHGSGGGTAPPGPAPWRTRPRSRGSTAGSRPRALPDLAARALAERRLGRRADRLRRGGSRHFGRIRVHADQGERPVRRTQPCGIPAARRPDRAVGRHRRLPRDHRLAGRFPRRSRATTDSVGTPTASTKQRTSRRVERRRVDPLGRPLGVPIHDVAWIDLGCGPQLFAAGDGVFRWSGAAWSLLPDSPGSVRSIEGSKVSSTPRGVSALEWSFRQTAPFSSMGGFTQVRASPIFAEPPGVSRPRSAPHEVVGIGRAWQGRVRPPDFGTGSVTSRASPSRRSGGYLHVAGTFCAPRRNDPLWLSWHGRARVGAMAITALAAAQGPLPRRYNRVDPEHGTLSQPRPLRRRKRRQARSSEETSRPTALRHNASRLPYVNLSLGGGVDGPPVLALATGIWRGVSRGRRRRRIRRSRRRSRRSAGDLALGAGRGHLCELGKASGHHRDLASGGAHQPN